MSGNVKWRMHRAAYLLLCGNSSEQVATELKVRPETISRWRRNPYFVKEYENIRYDMCEDMRVLLWAVAKDTFVEIASDKYRSQSRFDNALKFFKTIKIEQIFMPHYMTEDMKNPSLRSPEPERPQPAPKRKEKEEKKPIIERLCELSEEILTVENGTHPALEKLTHPDC